MKKAVFLDRDGIVNIDKAYIYKQKDFEFYDKLFEALKHFQDLGYLLIIVTNQSGIARGYYKEEDFQKLTNWMIEEFSKNDINITRVYHCPHSPNDNCECRKPKPKMFNTAKDEFNIDLKNSWMIGDKQSDIFAGLNAGIANTIFVNSSTCEKAKYNVKRILDTIDIIKI